MITIFSPMRPFDGQFASIQLNAVRSWLALRPRCDVILIDDEEGTTGAAVQGLDVRVITEVKRSSRLKAPLLDSMLKAAAEHARYEILAYITADCLLAPDFVSKILRCHDLMSGAPYLAAGARVDISQPVDVKPEDPAWIEALQAAVKAYGKPHGHTALDLWVYPKELDLRPPPFPIGRAATDNYAVYEARRRRVPVIDFTDEILVVHQYHDRASKTTPLHYEEVLECIRLFDGIAEKGLSLLDADWVLANGRLVRPRGLRRIHSMMSLCPPYRFLVGVRRKYMHPQLYGRPRDRSPVGSCPG